MVELLGFAAFKTMQRPPPQGARGGSPRTCRNLPGISDLSGSGTKRCASRRRCSVDGTARALRAAVSNGATVTRKQIVIPYTLAFQFAKVSVAIP